MQAMANLSLENLSVTAGHIQKINALHPRPLKALKPEDVYVRGMRLVGDRVTAHYGRIRTTDLPHVAELTIGAPVLVGHQKQTRPIGRFFDASVEDRFVIAPFFVPVARSDARDLITDIDSGVASEASISFTFTQPTCGKCGKDMRATECPHSPGRDGAFFYFDGITKVLEGSIVYRGAHPDTGFFSISECGARSAHPKASLGKDEDWQALIHKPRRKTRVFLMGGQPIRRKTAKKEK
jgi:hypothetical protein